MGVSVLIWADSHNGMSTPHPEEEVPKRWRWWGEQGCFKAKREKNRNCVLGGGRD